MNKCKCKQETCSICNNIYQLAILEGRAKNMTLTEYLNSLDGNTGLQGKSNYALWLEAGYTGSLEDYLIWLRDSNQGTDLIGVINANVFKRSNSIPVKPTGGSYEDARPTDTSWKDIPPTGTDPLYMSEAVFTSTGDFPARDWSDPMLIATTDSLSIKWSNILENPGTPSTHPSNWKDSSDSETVWLAMQQKQNGTWGAWNVIKIKGEAGEKGRPGDKTEMRFAKNGSFTAPPVLSTTVREPEGWSTKQPQKEVGEYIWATQTIIDLDTNTILYPWSEPVRYSGVDGISPFRIDLSNEMVSVPATYEGVVIGSIPGTTASVYQGGELETGWLFGASFTNCAGSIDSVSGVLTMTSLTGEKGEVVITAQKDSYTVRTIFNITKVRAGKPGEDPVIYSILPSATSVKVNKAGAVIPSTLTCKKFKAIGNKLPEETTDHTLVYKVDEGADQNYVGAVSVPSSATSITFILKEGSKILDIESVPVLQDGTDGSNGTDGQPGQPGQPGEPGKDGSGIEAKYFVTTVGQSAPDINTETGWVTTPPTLSNLQTLWEKIRVINGNGTFGPWAGPFKKTGDDGTGTYGPSMSYRGDWSNIKQYSGSANVVDVVKYNGKGYVARVDAGLIPSSALPDTPNSPYWNKFTDQPDAIFTDFLFAYSGYIADLTVGQIKTANEGERFTIGFMPTDLSDPTSNAASFSKHGERAYNPSGRIAMYDGSVKNFTYEVEGVTKTVNGYARIVFKDEVNSPVFYVLDSTSTGGIQYVTVTPDRFSRFPMRFVTDQLVLTPALISNEFNRPGSICVDLVLDDDNAMFEHATVRTLANERNYQKYSPGSQSTNYPAIVQSTSGLGVDYIPDGWYFTDATLDSPPPGAPLHEVVQNWILVFSRYVAGVPTDEKQYKVINTLFNPGDTFEIKSNPPSEGLNIYLAATACTGEYDNVASIIEL